MPRYFKTADGWLPDVFTPGSHAPSIDSQVASLSASYGVSVECVEVAEDPRGGELLAAYDPPVQTAPVTLEEQVAELTRIVATLSPDVKDNVKLASLTVGME